jgi:lysophospholipase L1-like esterase
LSLSSLALVLASLLPAGLLAQPAHNFARWEKEISAYEEMDRTNPPPKGALLFVGSSTIRLWRTLAQDFPDRKVINRGFGGSEVVDSTHFADRLIFPHAPRMIFFRAGGNDIAADKSPEQVFADFKEFVACVQAKLPATEIVFISWNPTIARWQQAGKEKALNDMVKEFAQTNPRVKYLEAYDLPLGADGKPRPELFVADKLHFNSEGYKLLAARVRVFLKKEK